MKELKFKGTPGPWTISEYGVGTNKYGVKTIRLDQPEINSVNCIEVYANLEGDELILMADARLISATPEMLEALIYARDCLLRMGNIGDFGDQALQSVESAIEKATTL